MIESLRLDLMGDLLLAAVLGGLIGWDREASGKPAGLRTNMLICIGATLLSDLSLRFALVTSTDLIRADPARLAAQIVSGVGFLGAGTIIQARGSVIGLTTAATLWVVAAIGIAIGSDHPVEAVGATVLVLLTLYPLRKVEAYYERSHARRPLRLELEKRQEAVARVETFLRSRGLDVRIVSVRREGGDRLVVLLDVGGDEATFAGVRQELAELPEVLGLEV